ncbi:MAG: ATP synthase F0 subunit B [Lawsonibacter sp.]|nr:ATP synthase F0 subunit B [Lawsonibacter sp.]
MASGVEELLDMLYEIIDEAKNAPFATDKCIIERDRALDLLEDIRGQFPMELSEARKMMANRAELVASARREAEAIRRAAEDKAKRILSESAIVVQAQREAEEIIQKARSEDLKLRRSANQYCEDALRRTEEAVAEAYDEIKKSRARFRAAAGASAPPSQREGGRYIYDAAADED